MYNVIYLFQWKICPLYQDINLDLHENKFLAFLKSAQLHFAESFDIPFLSLTTLYTRSKIINNVSIPDGLELINKAHFKIHYLEPGILTYEIDFNTKIIDFNIFLKTNVDFFKIQNRKLLSHVIDFKIKNCLENKRTGKLCSSCLPSNVIQLPVIRVFRNFSHLSKFEKRFTKNHLNQNSTSKIPIYRKKFQFTIYKEMILIYTKESRNYRKVTIEYFKYALILIKGVINFSKIVLTEKANNVFDKRNEKSSILNPFMDDFLKVFTFVFYWTNPKFLLERETERIHIKSSDLLVILIQMYRLLAKENFWSISDTTISLLNKISIQPFLILNDRIMKYPGNLFSNWINQIIPAKLNIILTELHATVLNEKEKKVFNALVNKVVSSCQTEELESSYQTEKPRDYFEILTQNAMSRRAIGKVIKKTGSSIQGYQPTLDNLIRKKLIVGVDPKKINVINRAPIVYYLNPFSPYTMIVVLDSIKF